MKATIRSYLLLLLMALPHCFQLAGTTDENHHYHYLRAHILYQKREEDTRQILTGRKRFQNQYDPQPLVCGAWCAISDDCSTAIDGCTFCNHGKCTSSTPTNRCGVQCFANSGCYGATDGCLYCVKGFCSYENPLSQCPFRPCSTGSDCADFPTGCTACETYSKFCGSSHSPPPPKCGDACDHRIITHYHEDIAADDRPENEPTCLNATDGCTFCNENIVCSTPPVLTKCGSQCNSNVGCSGAKDGCTACKNGACSAPTAPPKCGNQCTNNAGCSGATNGCTACKNGACSTPTAPPKCGSQCSNDAGCSGAIDGSTVCKNGTCSAPAVLPKCGSHCSSPAGCYGAQDGCIYCNNGFCSATVNVVRCGSQCSSPAGCYGAQDGCIYCTKGFCSATVITTAIIIVIAVTVVVLGTALAYILIVTTGSESR
jgi:hypothetical protein